MKRGEALSYAYDFMRVLMEKTGDAARDVILFGSVARGDFDRESDVDIFVNVPESRAKAVQKSVDAAINEFDAYSRHTWGLRGIGLPIRCIVGDIGSKKWSALRREMISSGIGLFGKYRELPKNLERRFIFSFSLAKLRRKDRVGVVRRVYGYSTKTGGRTYKHGGLLDEVGGEKINPSVIAVPDHGYERTVSFLKKNRVSFRVREIWSG